MMRAAPLAVLGLSIALAAAAPGRAFAQDQGEPQPKKEDRRYWDERAQEEMPKRIARFIKDQVELTDEQTTKIETILRDAFGEVMKRMIARMGEPEPPSREQIEKEMQEFRERIVEKVRSVMDDSQKKEFELLVKEFEQRAGTWEQRRDDPGREATSLFDGELPSKERLLVKAENALILNEDEKKVILPLVAKISDLRRKLREDGRERRRDIQKAIHSGAKPDEMRERLDTARAAEQKDRDALEKAESELRDLVTIEQEARLVAIGVLD